MTRLRKDGQPWGRMWDAWTPEEDQLLRELAGVLPAREIAARLTAFAGHPRTLPAVRCQAKRLNVSLWRGGYSLQELCKLFGVDHHVVREWWIGHGLLKARRWVRMGPHEGYSFQERDVEAFIRQHPYAYDPTRMRPGRLRSLAEVTRRSDPYITRHELARLLGYASGETLTRWIKRGLVPHVRRPKSGPHDQLLIRLRDVPRIQAAIEQATAEGSARKLAHARRLHLIRSERRQAAA